MLRKDNSCIILDAVSTETIVTLLRSFTFTDEFWHDELSCLEQTCHLLGGPCVLHALLQRVLLGGRSLKSVEFVIVPDFID